MKKKIVFSLTLALSLVMMSLTAFAAPKESVTPSSSSAKKGDTVTFTVALGSEEGSMDADVVVSGMEVVGVNDVLGLCTAGRVQLINGMSATYTCEITGDAGENATFALTNFKRGTGTEEPAATGEADAVTTVAITGEEPTEPSNPEEPTEPSNPEEPTEPSNPADPSNPSTPNGGNNGSNNNQSGTGTANGNLDKAPNTGDTTASVWPLVLIGCMGVAAAVVAGKKLVYRR